MTSKFNIYNHLDYIICFISMLLKIVTIVFRGDLPQRSVIFYYSIS